MRRERDEPVVVTPYRDGPLLVRGPIRLQDQDGVEIEVDRATIALCRCGRSRLRPFCDGSHKLIGFRAPSGLERRGSAALEGIASDHDAPVTPRVGESDQLGNPDLQTRGPGPAPAGAAAR